MDTQKVQEFTEATIWAKRIVYASLGIHGLAVVVVILLMLQSDAIGPALGMVWVMNAILEWVVGIVTTILILIWVYRANSNCHYFGAIDMNYSPGWAVGSYFIPFANAWFSYSSMREIWRASKDPVNWQRESAGAVVHWWWALLVATFFVGVVARSMWNGTSGEFVSLAFLVDTLFHLLSIPLCAVTLDLVDAVYKMQMDCFSQRKPQEV